MQPFFAEKCQLLIFVFLNKTLNEPSVGDTDSGSSITEQQKMPDLSEQTKLVQRKNNSMSAVVVPVSTSSSGDEGGLHEDMEDKPLDSAGEEVSHPAHILYRTSAIVSIWTTMNGMETEPQIKQTNIHYIKMLLLLQREIF